jgi:hypothetical protein
MELTGDDLFRPEVVFLRINVELLPRQRRLLQVSGSKVCPVPSQPGFVKAATPGQESRLSG